MGVDVWVVVGGAFLAAFCVGVAGFADALVAAAVWLYVLAPVEAVPLIVASGALIHGLTLFTLRHRLDFSRVVPFVVGGAIGVPFGASALPFVDAERFRLGVGVALVVYGLFALSRAGRGVVRTESAAADGLIGAIGGVLGGLAGLSGIVPAVWSGLRGWSAERLRGVSQPY